MERLPARLTRKNECCPSVSSDVPQCGFDYRPGGSWKAYWRALLGCAAGRTGDQDCVLCLCMVVVVVAIIFIFTGCLLMQ